MKRVYWFLLLCVGLNASAQIHLNGLKDNLKNKVNNSLHNAADAAKWKARQKAKEQIDKQFEKARNEFDESNFNYAISFSDNAALFETKEKGTRALNYINEYKEKKEGWESENDKKYDRAYMLTCQGEVWMASGKSELARIAFLAADSLYKNIDSAECKQYSHLMCDLGLLYQSTKRLTQAEKYIDRSLKIRREKMNGTAQLAVILNNKAVLLKDLGRYSEAENFIEESLKLSADSFGEKNLGYALALNNKAMLYQCVGRYEQAAVLMQKSVDISQQLLKETSANHIKLTINLALLLREMKKYPEAEKIYLNAIRIKEKKLGAQHPDYAHLKRGLALLYLSMGNMPEVEKNLIQAHQIYMTKFGAEHPATTAVTSDLAAYYRITGNKEKSLQLSTEAYSSALSVYGELHPLTVRMREGLALSQWQNSKLAEAADNFAAVLKFTENYIREYFSSLSESEKTAFWDMTVPRFNNFAAFTLASYKQVPGLEEGLFNLQLNNKAFLLNSSSRVRTAILNGSDVALKTEFLDWLAVKENLARCYTLSKAEMKEEKLSVDSLEKRAEQLEKSLSARSQDFSKQENRSQFTYTQVQAALKSGEAAVEIVRVSSAAGIDEKVAYATLILKSQGKPELIVFDDGANMEGTALRFYRSSIIERTADDKSYAVYWGPLETALSSVKKIYVSPDGIYNQISLNTLKDKTGKYLIDKFTIVQTGNSKDILASNTSSVLKKSAVLVGNPDFGSNDIIAPLPGTKTEVENIFKILSAAKYGPESYMKKEATEEKVKSLQASVLHFATHGFFLNDLSTHRGEKVLGVETASARKNPLLRSGLMLADCEKVFDETGEKANANNGILTAYEVMNLSLQGTDLVVLSACQTGLGDIKAGEGVYGLQRAFLIAGSKSVIMSLWEVSDDATMELMTEFYKTYTSGVNKRDAFIAAQKKIRIKYKEPYFWGAFVMVGN